MTNLPELILVEVTKDGERFIEAGPISDKMREHMERKTRYYAQKYKCVTRLYSNSKLVLACDCSSIICQQESR